MVFDDVGVACGLVEVVDILGDDGVEEAEALEFGEGVVAGVGLYVGEFLAELVPEGPDVVWVL